MVSRSADTACFVKRGKEINLKSYCIDSSKGNLRKSTWWPASQGNFAIQNPSGFAWRDWSSGADQTGTAGGHQRNRTHRLAQEHLGLANQFRRCLAPAHSTGATGSQSQFVQILIAGMWMVAHLVVVPRLLLLQLPVWSPIPAAWPYPPESLEDASRFANVASKASSF